ncbi:cysteine proteinase [Phaeosphaeriaceae sp. SRC1lsM3a]|nr:cysteine proteinase [Stagonospora sp. SRC1lsM3a]
MEEEEVTTAGASASNLDNGAIRTRGTMGLTNLGNTGWMNSALQCIRSVEELAAYFLQGEYKQDINAENPIGHGGAIAEAYAGLLAVIYREEGITSFAPESLRHRVSRANSWFARYTQQDAQEFVSWFIDALHEDLNRVKRKPYHEDPESDDKTVNDPEAIKALGDKFRSNYRSRNDSVAMDLFYGFYKDVMTCPKCDKVSITFDPYSLLTLKLPIEQTRQDTVRITLEECFAETYKATVCSEDNAWYCKCCKELRRAKNELEIWTAPDILLVHLRRFSRSSPRGKIDVLVDFPIEGLDLTDKVGLPEEKELVYDLFAVINHYHDGPGRGVNTAFAKNFFDQQWYEYNNSSVRKRDNPNSVITSAAYLLFYRRRSNEPLGPPKLREIVHAWRNSDYKGADDA